MTAPRKRDSVWHHEHKNGYIRCILYDDDRDVIVYFYNSRTEEAIPWDSFEEYNHQLKQWIIQ